MVLGAYQDRILTFTYSNVFEFNLDIKSVGKRNVGDWICDEFDVIAEGRISHEIQWQQGDAWRIVAERVQLLVSSK